MIPLQSLDYLASQTRRHFLRDGSLGLGGLALSMLLNEETTVRAAADPFAPRPPHFPAKAKNVIFLSMSGGPSHLDLFDYKPELVQRDGQDCPDSLTKGKPFAFTGGTPKLLGTPQKFRQHGKSGAWISAALPNLAASGRRSDLHQVDVHRAVQPRSGRAAALHRLPRTAGRPSLGSWVTYGLGSESRDLPGFIVFVSGGSLPSAGKSGWGNGFLPSVYQGVQCRTGGDPVLYLSDPEGMDRSLRRLSLDALSDLNEIQARQTEPSRDRHAHRPVRDGLPHAGGRARADGHLARAGPRSRGLRGAARRGQLRQQLPAGAPAGRKRGALRAAVRLGLGLPRHQPRRGHPR